MGTASAAEATEHHRWLLFSLRAGPFRVFNLCLRRQSLKWRSEGNVSKESFDSLTDLELGRPAATSRTTEQGAENLSEKSVDAEQPFATTYVKDAPAVASEDIELESAVRELSSKTDLLSRLRESTETVLGELEVLTRIWESQAMLRRAKTFKPSPAEAAEAEAVDRNLQQRSAFESRLRSAMGSCDLSQESYNQIQEVLQQPEASEFLNAATMVATEEFCTTFSDCLEQDGKRVALAKLLKCPDPRTEDERNQASELLEADALKGRPVLEFKVRRSLGLPMTVQWTPDLGLGSLKASEPEAVVSPRFAHTIPSNLSDI